MGHTTIRNQNLFCLNCGGEHRIVYPISVKEMQSKTDAFQALHNDCKKTWSEPEADQNKSIKDKAMWWVANGETGMSSKTMWSCFMGVEKFDISHPYDPDDFKRCYKLLQAVPEWKSELNKLKSLSTPWKNLVENWDTLTAMYEKNVEDNWKNYKKVGMYEFMQTLIKTE